MVNLRQGGLIMALVLAACASVSDPATSPEGPTADRLAPRDFKPGDCGLFVWTADRERRLILFSDNQSGKAVWAQGSGEEQLVQEAASGEPSHGQYARQDFSGSGGETLSLSLEQGEDITSGTRFPRGTLRVTNAEGWSRVIPVSGLAACQPTN